MLKRLRSRRGFTLIELLVVLVILALLAGIVLPRFMDRTKDAAVGAAKTQIGVFKQALSLYQLDNQQPPTTQQGLDALIQRPSSSPQPANWKPYLTESSVPRDPWGNEYHYESPGPNGEEFYVVSYGADGKPGGSGYDADLDSNQVQGK